MRANSDVRQIVKVCHQRRLRVRLLTGLFAVGFALGAAVTAKAACDTSDCAATANAASITEAAANPGRPVKLNAFNKRASKQAAVSKSKTARRAAPSDARFATKRAAKYARIANRVKRASQKFTVASAQAAAPTPAPQTPAPQTPRVPSAVSPFVGDSLKPLVADARAEMSPADLKAASDAGAPIVLADAGLAEPPMQVVSADQVNDIDRSAADAPAARPGQVLKPVSQQRAALVSTDSIWDQTSLIGKLFVAFGGILTLASAARMFIA